MKILYICTHNRCRSILSEAITNHLGSGRLQAISAGSEPADEVHPLTLRYLQERDVPVDGLYSKSWEDVTDTPPDLVITVCDNAANEACPVWLGNAVKLHWGLPDPSRTEGSEETVHAAFQRVMATIEVRVQQMLALPLEDMTPEQVRNEIHLSDNS